ncbi:MAG: hypothetical protein WDN00_02025 [Limisphaerales bacterium]
MELMVFLRPKVIRTPEDAQDVLNEVLKKAPLIQKLQNESNLPNAGEPSKKDN